MVSTLLASTATGPVHGKRDTAKLAYNTKELCAVLGISSRSLIRLEQRGLIRSSKVLRTKLYPHTEVERFLQDTLS